MGEKMKPIKPMSVILFLLLASVLQGCTPIVVGGAVTGASVVHDRRTAATALEDQTIEIKALRIVLEDNELKKNSKISATSYNQVVLLTGQAKSLQLRDRYAKAVREIDKVQRVVNEIEISPNATLAEKSSDYYLTSKVKLKLFEIKIKSFDPTRVKVVTEKSVVYLMGLVTQQEADAVVEKVRYVSGVKRVVKVFEQL
jgi:osmotically-inducible protein OsmY